MSDSIVTCNCGAKVRLPENSASRALRCPRCKETLMLTSDAIVLRTTALETNRDVVCPICQTGIEQGGACITCPGCAQIHHQECWAEIGGCGTYGCSNAPAIDKSEQ